MSERDDLLVATAMLYGAEFERYVAHDTWTARHPSYRWSTGYYRHKHDAAETYLLMLNVPLPK